MHIAQVRYFLALCDEQNFNLAARRCGVSQPTLSVGIQRLEKLFGGQLFYRQQPIKLTELGEAVRPFLRRLSSHANQAQRAASRVLADERSRVHLPVRPPSAPKGK